jgi:hypothetical protein
MALCSYIGQDTSMRDNRDNFVCRDTDPDAVQSEHRPAADANDLCAMGHAWERGLVTLLLAAILLAGFFGIRRPARALMRHYTQVLAPTQPPESLTE